MKTASVLAKNTSKSAAKYLISLAAGAVLMPAAILGEKGAFLPALAVCLPAFHGSLTVAGAVISSLIFGFEPSVVAMLASAAVGILIRLWFADESKRRFPLAAAVSSGLCSLSIRLIFAVMAGQAALSVLPATLGCIISAMAVYAFTSVFRTPSLSDVRGMDSSGIQTLLTLSVCALCAYGCGGFSLGKAALIFIASAAVYLLPKAESALFSGFACVGFVLGTGGLSAFALAAALAVILCPSAVRKSRIFAAGWTALAVSLILALSLHDGMLADCICSLAGAAAFALLPEKMLESLPTAARQNPSAGELSDGRGAFMACALERLSQRLEAVKPPERPSVGDMVYAGVCMNCEKYTGCYSDDSENSIEAPSHVCIHFDEMRRSAAEAERKLKSESANEAEALKRRDMFSSMISALSKTVTHTEESRMELPQSGVDSVYVSPEGFLRAYFKSGERVSGQRLVKAIEMQTGRQYRKAVRSEAGGYARLEIMPSGGITAESGSFQKPREQGGQGGQSGDYMSMFSAGQYLYAAVSDGMGTGEEAGICSQILVQTLKELIAAGFPPESAITLSAEYLKCSIEEESFATLDLMRINLITGAMDFYKCGGCKSFVISSDGAAIVAGGGYPAGIMDGVEAVKSSYSAKSGDTVIMMTDGAMGIEPSCICDMMDSDAETLASMLGTAACKAQTSETADDITILVIKLSDKE